MKKFTLIRTVQGDDGTFGHLVHADFHLVTGEPEAPRPGNKGCIPAGTYQVVWEPVGKFRGYALKGVPGFSNIELHVGNTEDDSKGCILVGRKRGKLGDKEAVLESAVALQRLEMYLAHEPFELEILERF